MFNEHMADKYMQALCTENPFKWGVKYKLKTSEQNGHQHHYWKRLLLVCRVTLTL